ncbi:MULTISPECIES: hypothetical protein [Yersinia]|uniref:hypothetical protein n=1 Tax=Yersinia TaxID=629 RepID=UPI0005E747D3|nr:MULTISPECIES: hypothetical protein [Yersinia]MDN0106255.1 hypothetical protein [Yersinia rochesterensis]CNK96636.1 Uncharacterised protein [Yersinia kristensenii]
MNLNNNPTEQELSGLIAVCDDKAGNHILWVSKAGDVEIALLINQGPIAFEESTPSMAMRYETFQQGNDYVGKDAAGDTTHVSRLFNDLINEWGKYSGKGVTYIS